MIDLQVEMIYHPPAVMVLTVEEKGKRRKVLFQDSKKSYAWFVGTGHRDTTTTHSHVKAVKVSC